MNIGAAFRGFFGLDDDYVRPAPKNPWPADILIAVVLMVVSVATLLQLQQIPEAIEYAPLGPGLLAIFTGGALIALRRRFPITVLLLGSGAHFILIGVLVPLVASIAGMQVLYFFGIYTAMAYARRRDTLMLATVAVLASMAVWLLVSDAYTRTVLGEIPGGWYYFATVTLNTAYFGAALFLGRQSWQQAKSEDELRRSREMVRLQGEQLAHQAVLAERLRIARDLHDSVAHHISLIGVQTAAARRAMASRPELASEAMQEVEELSRGAVQELRGLLGSLRDVGPDGENASLGSLEQLCAEADGSGLQVRYDLVGDPASLGSLTPTQASSLLRIAQEALTNVRRHSTADEARVVLRISEDTVELEVTDNGMPVPGTTGSGLGHVGMRERISALGGQLDVGPRATRGYRVRASFLRKASA
ncbi:sensor histidine kinase [Tessaracoccus caeni]|uniref:sensor histidine kinase n=1 Tax=Tessaracoccus caeni TaxID=3031239 RepID=UPI0023DCE9F9|nr:sensor histidine kinase [Tessaracoccus caeni]MDF1486852.1 sensor histidine kinase [Tessaracoccus caeni]